MIKILLIMIGLGTSIFADFLKSGDVVTDSKTGLQWQDDTDAKNITKSWQGAIDYCEALGLEGESDWRLPNINELVSLVDDTKSNPSIDTITFQNVASSFFYWSSTTSASNSNAAWYVYFNYGYKGISSKFNGSYIRCVRAGQ